MIRRNWLVGGTAVLAGLAGVGVAWQKFQPHKMEPSASDAFWGMSFDTPEGKPLAMRSFKGQSVLVNFWATWCPPCVEELPLLDSFYKSNKNNNWTVLGLAVDQPSAVNKWLRAKPLAFPVGMAGLEGTELSKTLGNRSGSLPFTVVFGASGGVLQRKIGKVTEADLLAWSRLK